jgi:Protein of unknown function (DUF3662)
MNAVERKSADHFLVRFQPLARRLIKGFRRDSVVQVDPFLIARAVTAVMAECTFRSSKGQRLLWNEYRVILARADYELVRALQGPLERDLGEALSAEATATGAELVGELRVNVIFDEGKELRAGEAVIRVAFVATAKLGQIHAGELTVRFDAGQLTGLMKAVGSTETVIVQDSGVGPSGYRLLWPGGDATLTMGVTVIAGRPHHGPPASFIALVGASPKINKQHLWISAAADSVRIGRPATANPVQVNSTALAAGAELTVVAPAHITLSRGELLLQLTEI